MFLEISLREMCTPWSCVKANFRGACVEKIKRENLIKLSIFFTWINVIHIYVSIVKIYWLKAPWHYTKKVIHIKLLGVYLTTMLIQMFIIFFRHITVKHGHRFRQFRAVHSQQEI